MSDNLVPKLLTMTWDQTVVDSTCQMGNPGDFLTEEDSIARKSQPPR